MRSRAIAVIMLVAGGSACLITQPPGDPPPSKARRPIIRLESVKPKLTQPITVIQPTSELSVLVESDPETKLAWRVYLDFDQLLGGAQLADGELAPDPTLMETRLISVPLFTLTLDTGLCHTLTLRVAEAFSTSSGSNWTPLPPGGDEATWFYRPNGAEPCPGYDAGSFADAAAFDTGTE